ncbi:LysR family transcriptional regulator [Cedecea neteri]|nr:LysR family transcriptional regulator [Cedecea neteri]AJZ88385.1 LysR family transcriptional regulator [Klebsiella michiganensis]WPU22096.1 LysR family transcriptional regulator [Cedecea neteri]
MRVNLDVLLILDALDKHGSFAAAAESLFKTPAALSYMVQKLENDLNIKLLDRSGHRAKFTDTGRIVLEKGRMVLSAAKDLESQALRSTSGWEKTLTIALDGSFPFHLLLPLMDEFYALDQQTTLNFTHHTLAGAWEELTHNGAHIILGAINEPPTSSEYSYKMLGTLDNVFVVSPDHALAKSEHVLTSDEVCRHRAAIIGDTARYCHPINTNYIEEQERVVVYDFPSKVAILAAGLACGFLPRHIAQPLLNSGKLIEKPVVSFRQTDVTYIGWHNRGEGLAARWWREKIIEGDLVNSLYQLPTDS